MSDQSRRDHPSGPAHQRPLLVTADHALLDELLRLTAAAGATPLVAPDPPAARRHWSRAPCVVIGHDAAESCAQAGLPARERVAVLLPDDPGTRALPWGAAGRLGAGYVAPLTAARPWLTAWFRPAPDVPAAPLVCVTGGGGGAGASVFAAALALTAARSGERVLLLDADPQGGGLDVLLGWEGRPGLRWPDLDALGETPDDLHDVLPTEGDLAVLSARAPDPRDLEPAPPIPERLAVRLLERALRTYDLVVADLPRHPDPVAARLAERCTASYLVVRGDVHGGAAARNTVRAYAPHWEPPGLVVRRTPGVALPAEDMAAVLDLHVAGAYDNEGELADRVHQGSFERFRPRGRLAALCASLLDGLRPAPEPVR